MAFENIKPLEKAQTYLDIAFKKAVKRTKVKKVRGTTFNKVKSIELNKLTISKDVILARFNEIIYQFPRISELNPYYQELARTTINLDKYLIALAKIKNTPKKVNEIFKTYDKAIKTAADPATLNRLKRQYYARVSSIVKETDNSLKFLIECRKIFQSFPTIRERLRKIAIAGFPNVGKSTLLSKLSSSKPEIASYAFTTKKIMVGYIEKNKKKHIQLLDTPGTLNRIDKMNPVEKQAYLAMKMVADEIIYVFDLTETYPVEDQIRLYKRIKSFNKPMIIYLSKTDILDKKTVLEFKKKFEEAITDHKELKKMLNAKKPLIKE